MKLDSVVRQASCLAAILMLAGCASTNTFVATPDAAWAALTVRTDVSYDQSWDKVVEYLTRRFDLDVLSRNDGYLRTTWCNTWEGKQDDAYRVRVTLKFSPDRKTLEVKTEAEKGGAGHWVLGYDTRLTDTARKDLATLVGVESYRGEAK
jgi:hypothetical protein